MVRTDRRRGGIFSTGIYLLANEELIDMSEYSAACHSNYQQRIKTSTSDVRVIPVFDEKPEGQTALSWVRGEETRNGKYNTLSSRYKMGILYILTTRTCFIHPRTKINWGGGRGVKGEGARGSGVICTLPGSARLAWKSRPFGSLQGDRTRFTERPRAA